MNTDHQAFSTMLPLLLFLLLLVLLLLLLPLFLLLLLLIPQDGELWVLLVAGSNGWFNYRHQVRHRHMQDADPPPTALVYPPDPILTPARTSIRSSTSTTSTPTSNHVPILTPSCPGRRVSRLPDCPRSWSAG